MTEEQAKALRAPFKPEQIGKLPKPTKRDNAKGRCKECGGWHGLPAVHLDYVGHAAITDRLLEVDPDWSWEPMAVGPNGEPLLTNGGLWIKLTVCGVTRPGFGDETNGKGMKEVIGDALRNAAMRFGVGLDLWSKERLHADESDEPSPAPEPPATDALYSELVALGETYKELVPEFNITAEIMVKAEKHIGKAGYEQWLRKYIAALQAQIREKSAELEAQEQFPIPDKAKAA